MDTTFGCIYGDFVLQIMKRKQGIKGSVGVTQTLMMTGGKETKESESGETGHGNHEAPQKLFRKLEVTHPRSEVGLKNGYRVVF